MSNNMTKYIAEQILGLSGSYTAADVRTAYRHAVKNNHPDRVVGAGGNVDEANAKMADINAAYDYLVGIFGDGRERVECSADEFHAQPTAKPEPEPVDPGTNIAGFHDDILDPDAAAAARQAHKMADDARASREALERELYKEPLWYGIIECIAEHFPYRLGLLALGFVILSLGVGFNVIATMGYAPMDWNPQDTNGTFGIIAFLFWFASVINLFVPFMSNPLRELVLAGIERARKTAFNRRAHKLGLA